LSATNPENETVTYSYDATNNLIAAKTDAIGQQTQDTDDSYNRVTEVQHFLYQYGTLTEHASQRVMYYYDTNPPALTPSRTPARLAASSLAAVSWLTVSLAADSIAGGACAGVPVANGGSGAYCISS
jgi:YD repeat-containing protein